MRKLSSIFIASLLCFCFVSVASAGDITYQVTVDTSSIAGTAGSFDFQFNPGPLITQAASLQILNFSGNGSLAGIPMLTGNVSGALPTTLTFDNGTAFNDYFEGFKFGSSLTFNVSLYGPALSSPNGTATSGSTFAFSMFSDAAGTIPTLTTDTIDGFASLINVNLDGTTTVTNYSLQTTVAPVPAVPEPNAISVMLAGMAIALVTLGIRRSVWRRTFSRELQDGH